MSGFAWFVVIVVAGWFILSTVLVVVRRDIFQNEDELHMLVFVIVTWPGWLLIAIMGSPVALGLLMGMLIRELAKELKGG